MASEPSPDLRMLMGGVVIGDRVDQLPGRNRPLDSVEEANGLLVPVSLHAAADDRAIQDVQRGEQRGGAVPLVVMGHCAGASLLHRQPGLGAVERLDLALLVDRQHDGMSRWIDIQANDVRELLQEAWIRRELERLYGVRPYAAQICCTERRLTPVAAARARPVQCVVSPGGAASVRSTTCLTVSPGSGRLPGGRVLSRRRPSTPSCMNRSCQRQTTGFDRPERRTIFTCQKYHWRKSFTLNPRH